MIGVEFIKDLNERQKLWKVSDPLLNGYTEKDWEVPETVPYIVSSFSIAKIVDPETLIFPCNEDGEINDFIDLARVKEYSHDEAISLFLGKYC